MVNNGSKVTIKEYIESRFNAFEKRLDKFENNDLFHMKEKLEKIYDKLNEYRNEQKKDNNKLATKIAAITATITLLVTLIINGVIL